MQMRLGSVLMRQLRFLNKSEEAKKEGKIVYTFGANRDKSEISPTVIANAVITPDAFVQIAKLIRDGDFKPQVYTFNMLTDEAITLVYNPALKDKVPAAVQKSGRRC